MAMSSCVVRRAASCSSSLIALATRYARAPLANRSPGSSSFPPLLHLRLLPFSTDSPESPEFPNSKQTASGTSDKVSLPALGSSSARPRFLRFSTTSAKDLATRAESALEKSAFWACYRDQSFLPVPDGFPFSIKDFPYGVDFLRKETDERIEISIHLNSYQLVEGNPCYQDTEIYIRRGYWYVKLAALVRSNMLRIRHAYMSELRNHHLKCYEEILDSKGIDARKIFDLFRKVRGESEYIRVLESGERE